MKSIKVLGSCCSNCDATLKLIDERAKILNIAIQLEKVTDIATIMGYGAMSTPGVVIDETLVHAGGVPRVSEIDAWLR